MFNSDTYCALLILIELGDRYLINGCTVAEISEKHHVPVCELEGVVPKLESAGLIRIERDDKEWLFMKSAPKDISIHDVVELFGSNFSGQFFDKETGAYLQQSNTLKFIKKEQGSIDRVMKSRLRRINLDECCHMCRTNTY